MTTVDATRPVTGGVDTHLDVKVAAALDPIGGLLGVAEFPTTPVGHRRLAEFLVSFGILTHVGVEGTGSYGAGLSRFLRNTGVEVVEVDRPVPSAHGQVGPGRRHRGGPGRLVGQSPGRRQESGRQRGGDQGARCRQALIAFDKDPDARSVSAGGPGARRLENPDG
ncbi:MAG: hypothetical protein ABSD85_17940 [Acidimicrobiales bacterium]|jgi:hypothetical protein